MIPNKIQPFSCIRKAVMGTISSTRSCRLNVWRNDDGKLNLNVNKVNPDSEWNAGNGVLCRNTNFLHYLYIVEFFDSSVFSIPFFHPPSIRPISSKSAEIFTY